MLWYKSLSVEARKDSLPCCWIVCLTGYPQRLVLGHFIWRSHRAPHVKGGRTCLGAEQGESSVPAHLEAQKWNFQLLFSTAVMPKSNRSWFCYLRKWKIKPQIFPVEHVMVSRSHSWIPNDLQMETNHVFFNSVLKFCFCLSCSI